MPRGCEVKIYCNNQPRFVLNAWDLTEKERAEFDYLPEGEGSFFRYRGACYDIGEFSRIDSSIAPHPQRPGWESFHGYASDSFFSGTLIRLSRDGESVTVARYIC
jgi:hypothetical protein